MAMDIQTHVIRTCDIVNYSGLVKSLYPIETIQSEPIIGIKILCKDTQANTMIPAQRIAQLDQFLGTPNQMNGFYPLSGTGCCIRETKYSIMPDGFWLISLPVPRSILGSQIERIISTIKMLKSIGINQEGYVEINVSGRCSMNGVESCLKSLMIPEQYLQYADQNNDSPYKLGNIERINEDFICFRSRWRLPAADPNLFQNIIAISLLISAMYR